MGKDDTENEHDNQSSIAEGHQQVRPANQVGPDVVKFPPGYRHEPEIEEIVEAKKPSREMTVHWRAMRLVS